MYAIGERRVGDREGAGLQQLSIGGWGGIRTPETLAGLPVFKTGAFNHSATHPARSARPLRIEMGSGTSRRKGAKGLRHRRLPYGARTHPKARRCVNVSAVIYQAALARNAPRDQLGKAPDAFALCVAMASIRAGERQS